MEGTSSGWDQGQRSLHGDSIESILAAVAAVAAVAAAAAGAAAARLAGLHVHAWACICPMRLLMDLIEKWGGPERCIEGGTHSRVRRRTHESNRYQDGVLSLVVHSMCRERLPTHGKIVSWRPPARFLPPLQKALAGRPHPQNRRILGGSTLHSRRSPACLSFLLKKPPSLRQRDNTCHLDQPPIYSSSSSNATPRLTLTPG